MKFVLLLIFTIASYSDTSVFNVVKIGNRCDIIEKVIDNGLTEERYNTLKDNLKDSSPSDCYKTLESLTRAEKIALLEELQEFKEEIMEDVDVPYDDFTCDDLPEIIEDLHFFKSLEVVSLFQKEGCLEEMEDIGSEFIMEELMTKLRDDVGYEPEFSI